MTGQRVTKPGDRVRVCQSAIRYKGSLLYACELTAEMIVEEFREGDLRRQGRIRVTFPGECKPCWVRSWIIVQEGGREFHHDETPIR